MGMTNERSDIETGCGALRLLFQRRFCRTLHWCAPLDEGFSELAIPTPKQSQQISKAFGSLYVENKFIHGSVYHSFKNCTTLNTSSKMVGNYRSIV